MHITTKDKALAGLKDAHYYLINQPSKENGEWEIIELIAKAITKLEKIKPAPDPLPPKTIEEMIENGELYKLRGTITKAQQHVVDLMRQGWELRRTGGIAPQAFLWGRKGDMRMHLNVRITTFYALENKGLLEKKSESFPYVIYGLKEN